MATKNKTKPGRPEYPKRDKVIPGIRVFPDFLKNMDAFWKAEGYKSRTDFILELVAKKIKWKGPY